VIETKSFVIGDKTCQLRLVVKEEVTKTKNFQLGDTGSATGFRGYLPRTGNYLLTISVGSKATCCSLDVSIPQRISTKWAPPRTR